uniref:Peptidase C1A papain C-terminal domain-containing protein n=1 Tax=Aegilops tauschii subsp. strangulata TaxID=200361 RepID=A0A453B043_AEGTS
VMNVPVDHGILNHAMLLIGYNATSWLLLNSWSEAWGIKEISLNEWCQDR